MVCANYCTPYPKWLCVKYEANIWCPCCIMSFCFRTFYSFFLSPVINIVTILSDVTDVTVWPITSNLNPIVLKIEENKNKKENKKETKSTFYDLDTYISRSLIVDVILFFLFILFYFTLLLLFSFLFLEQLGLEFISHTVTSVTNWWRSHQTDHET